MFSSIGVVGCGLMGAGIAQVCAQAGYRTIVRDVSSDLVDRGIEGIGKRLRRLEEKGELSAGDREAALDRLSGTTELAELAGCDLVLEAVVEDIGVKNAIWKELDGLCPAETIFASNTSSLTISDMAAAVERPGRIIGLHFFNPVPVMKLVEVVRTVATEGEVLAQAIAFVASLGKEAVECGDSSGFVVNRLLVPYMMDAIRAVEQGIASIEEIDRAMRLGAGHPMGPLTLCDFVGNDTLARIGEIMFDEYHEQRFAAPPLLKRMVSLGYLGRKSGRGFYDYGHEPPRALASG